MSFSVWLVFAQVAVAQPSVETGRQLFFDKRLSADSSVSCATCHDPQRGFADSEVLSPGVLGRKGNRHTPSLIGRGAGTLQFWDGRSPGLEQQVLEPIRNPNEMGMTVAGVVERLKGE